MKNFIQYKHDYKKFGKIDIFFVGISHKLDKKGMFYEAFDNTTNSGKLIDKIVKLCDGFSIYKTNLVKGAPLDNNNKIRYPNHKEKLIGLKILQSEINKFNPKLVYLFGKQVHDFVCKNLSVVQINSDEYKYGTTIFVLSEHPSYIMIYKRKYINNYISKIIDKINEKCKLK